MRFVQIWGRPRGGNVAAVSAAGARRAPMLHYGWAMPDRPALSRPVAIALVVLTGVAFVGILGGLAVGRIDIAGISGVVLVVLWFVVLGVRGRR